MRDEIDSRLWQRHHQSFADNMASLFASIGTAMRRLNEIQFDAPWKHGAPPQA